MPSARWWKDFYAAERHRLGVRGLLQLLDLAPRIDLPARGALVFPHAKLEGCGGQVAVVAEAVVRSGAERVLALGVLHGGRERDAEAVARARLGDPQERSRLRGVHRADGLAAEEFSLDGFGALLALAARRAGKPPPELIARYPFLVDGDAASLPGLDELLALRDGGCALVATADHVHHGAGYGTPAERRLERDDPRAAVLATEAIEGAFAALARDDRDAFARVCSESKSDFRDPGPVLAALLRQPWRPRIEALTLVDYAADLAAESPTWVAAGLVAVG